MAAVLVLQPLDAPNGCLDAMMCLPLLPVVGELELWNKAEAALEEALNSTGREWVMNPGDGAFYGPKIDITGKNMQQVHC